MNSQSERQVTRRYAKPVLWRSIVQILNTVLPLSLTYFLIGLLWQRQIYWLIVPMVPIASAFMVRTFILFHDCTHLAFFRSTKANVVWGHLFGILTFTPYRSWQDEHNQHHGAVGNLDKRGIGDVWTMTLNEYLNASKGKRLIYHIYRNPIFLFFIAPIFLFGLINRFPSKGQDLKDHLSLAITNVGIAFVAVTGGLWLGFWTYLLLQLLTLYFAGVMGVWLFFVQHQFEEAYWEGNDKWDFTKAALTGSSFYKLPKVLDWISGSIGYHHIHHLNPRIPNYHLKKCHQELEGVTKPYTVTLFKSFRLALLHLYDDTNGRLVSFKAVSGRKVQST